MAITLVFTYFNPKCCELFNIAVLCKLVGQYRDLQVGTILILAHCYQTTYLQSTVVPVHVVTTCNSTVGY